MHSPEGIFEGFGGRYVPEVLIPPLQELRQAFHDAQNDPAFREEFDHHSQQYTGRPTPLLHAQRSSDALGGAQIFVKLEGLANTGAHKINNVLGQILLAKRLGKSRIIAETGAGQHGAATAAVCAKMGLECVIYMGLADWYRQYPNVYYMELFGAKVVPVRSGSQTLKDAVNEALRDWAEHFADTHYLIGSALGPDPYPDMVREFQSVIGRELVEQMKKERITPDALLASVGGGSNALGFFSQYLNKPTPRLIGVEAGGDGTLHAARMNELGRPGIIHGYKSIFLTDEDGQVKATHSVAAGLDYPGIGPQLAALGTSGRVEFLRAKDSEALEALQFFALHEGLIFALESAHAAAAAMKLAPQMGKDQALIVHMSGRGDKDIFISAPRLSRDAWKQYLQRQIGELE